VVNVVAKIVGKMPTGLQSRFASEDESDHPYVRLLNIAKNPLTPIAIVVSALEILLKYRMPTLSAQLVQVNDTRDEKPVGRLTIMSLLSAERVDPKTKEQLRAYFLEEEQKQLNAPEGDNESKTEITS
jgi:hypothetical protein